ncbi:hypothetical protein NIES970_08420 [[Synechococcus] sp. NIES-970]|nr:hypothetical protein NIES970_08240 [[Synechococcus] sp. NIES-970]BAW95924.1 hypothetical protein NIES970_08420 [[Synechococcus] sp. NIES-970]
MISVVPIKNLFEVARIREKNCEICQNVVFVRYRIQHDPSQQWILVCPDCRRKLAENNAHYRYGGTWKAKKRH